MVSPLKKYMGPEAGVPPPHCEQTHTCKNKLPASFGMRAVTNNDILPIVTPDPSPEGAGAFFLSGESPVDDEAERFRGERLLLNVGRTPGTTQFWRRFQTAFVTYSSSTQFSSSWTNWFTVQPLSRFWSHD